MPEDTPSRDEFLRHLWQQTINVPMTGQWIDHFIWLSEHKPDAPFADLGGVVRHLLALGASRRELSLIARHGAYGAVFSTLYALEDPGVDQEDCDGLYESILSADPSGLEGRPGSAPGAEHPVA